MTAMAVVNSTVTDGQQPSYMTVESISSCHVLDDNMSDTWTGSRSDTSHESSHDDATWILTSAFIIFMMQSGFGLLESGSVASKNEVNIMVKNAVDVIFGGLTYWMFGFGLSFGEDPDWSNPFCGWGYFFVSANESDIGWVHSKFFFQASFATTATTIVSGAMAERAKLESYIIFSLFNTFIVCFPAHWVWAPNGWLANLGMIDIAGAGPVHIVGGVTGLVATMMLKPRYGRFTKDDDHAMGSPSNAVLGLFMLWWGWLGFNCGSTFGISGLKWKLAARSAVATICASIAGGIVGLLFSYVKEKRRFDVPTLINGLLSALVSITALCALAEPWMAFCIGAIGALLSLLAVHGLDKLQIDDPVGCVGVHAVGGIWGLVSVGLFAKNDILAKAILNQNSRNFGLINCGTVYLVSIQLLASVVLIAWTCVTSFVILKVIDLALGLRVSQEEELLGSDLVEHGITTTNFRYDKVHKTIIYINKTSPNRSPTILMTPEGQVKVTVEDATNDITLPAISSEDTRKVKRDLKGVKKVRKLFLSGCIRKGIFKSRHHVSSRSSDITVELDGGELCPSLSGIREDRCNDTQEITHFTYGNGTQNTSSFGTHCVSETVFTAADPERG